MNGKSSVSGEKKIGKKYPVVLALLLLLLTVVGAAYAYFQAQRGDGTTAGMNVSSGTTDLLTFNVVDLEVTEEKLVDLNADDAIIIDANQDNFKEHGNSIGDGVTASATLKANNTTNRAQETYNIFFVIENNDLRHTVSEEAPELILRITDPENNPVTDLPDLTYNEEAGGFDITERHGTTFKIVENHVIEATDETPVTQNWQVEVILKNLDSDQNENAGKSFTGKLYVTDKDEVYTLAAVHTISAASKTHNSITAKAGATKGTKDIDKYYFAIEETQDRLDQISLMSNIVEKEGHKFHESKTDTYEFTETDDGEKLKANQSYEIYCYAVDVEGFESEIIHDIIVTDDYTKATIDEVSVEKTSKSIKVTVTKKTPGKAEIEKYMFKYQYDKNWSEAQENPDYTFTNLSQNREYTLNIIGIDSNGEYSQEYTLTERTLNQYTVYAYAYGGTLNVSKNYGDEGKEATFTITANEGNNLNEAYVITGDCTLSEVNDNSRTLIAENLTGERSCTVKIPAIRYTLANVCNTGDNLVSCVKKLNTTYPNKDDTDLILHNGTTTIEEISGESLEVVDQYKSQYSTWSDILEIKCGAGYKLSNGFCVNDMYRPGPTYYGLKYDASGKTFDTYDEAANQAIADGYVKIIPIVLDANDGSYRYSGDEPYNFVCFGSNETPCPPENIYRIIGVFNIDDSEKVKLIKSEYLTEEELGIPADDKMGFSNLASPRIRINKFLHEFYWNDSLDNDWSNSVLKNALNNTADRFYLNNLGIWADKIAVSTWNLDGNNSVNLTPKKIFDIEANSTKKIQAKIGLMYLSDYGFAAETSAWERILSDHSIVNNILKNWLYTGVNEWTILPLDTGNVAYINTTGNVQNNSNSKVNSNKHGVRPTFYLNDNITYQSGTGSHSSPFYIN